MNTIAGNIVMQKLGRQLSVVLLAKNMHVNLLFPGFKTVQPYRRLCMTEQWIASFSNNGLTRV